MNKREARKARYTEILRSAAAVSEEEEQAACRELALQDVFFLLTRVLKRRDVDHDWLYDRCLEVQRSPDGHLDLWARDHYKSTIITFGMTIQDVLRDPEITIGIFSHTRPIAKGFLTQIKREFEDNAYLKDLFSDILWAEPKKQAPRWSVDDGIIVKRKGNPKESTVEAWGLVDGQPTSKHFSLLIYDDVVTIESVTTPEMIKKVTGAWEISLNLGTADGRIRYIGTRYHFNDSYKTMMDRKSADKRIYPATDTGKVEGKPVFLTPAVLAQKRRDMGPYVFGCQMLQDPTADEVQGFKEDWIKFWRPQRWSGMNRYILVDPASEKKKTSDYTAMWVIGAASDGNFYSIFFFRDRLNLPQRTKALFRLHRLYQPIRVGYEKYGKDSDIEHIQSVMVKENYRFPIVALGGSMPKNDRIRRLIPYYEQGKIFLPETCPFIDAERKKHDATREFIDEEYLAFPVAVHDDWFDCQARILDAKMNVRFPMPMPTTVKQQTPKSAAGWT